MTESVGRIRTLADVEGRAETAAVVLSIAEDFTSRTSVPRDTFYEELVNT